MVEMEVAFAAFGVLLAGLCPVVVAQLKHVARLESRFQPWTADRDWQVSQSDASYYVVPRPEPWARKLSGTASVARPDPGLGASTTPTGGNTVTVLGLVASPNVEDATATVLVAPALVTPP